MSNYLTRKMNQIAKGAGKVAGTKVTYTKTIPPVKTVNAVTGTTKTTNVVKKATYKIPKKASNGIGVGGN